MNLEQIITPNTVGFLTPNLQILIVCFLFLALVITQYIEYKNTGKVWKGKYPLKTSSFFAPVYEEVIFRGIILAGLAHLYDVQTSIIVSSLLFGLWHIKNIFYFPRKELVFQISYTGIVLGPILALTTVAFGNIWIAVIIHFCNNLLASKTLSCFRKHS